MVEEQGQLKTQLACLENRRLEVVSDRSKTTVRQSHIDNWSVDSASGDLSLNAPEYQRPKTGAPGTLQYLTLDEIVKFLTDRKVIETRLEELDQLLSI